MRVSKSQILKKKCPKCYFSRDVAQTMFKSSNKSLRVNWERLKAFKEVRGSFAILFWLPCATWHRVMTHTHHTQSFRSTDAFLRHSTPGAGPISEVSWGILLHPQYDKSAKDRSANDTSAKPTVRMPTVRRGQQCEWDKSANANSANASSAMRHRCEKKCNSSANSANSANRIFFLFFTDWKIQQQSSSSSKKKHSLTINITWECKHCGAASLGRHDPFSSIETKSCLFRGDVTDLWLLAKQCTVTQVKGKGRSREDEGDVAQGFNLSVSTLRIRFLALVVFSVLSCTFSERCRKKSIDQRPPKSKA